jgi:hypothetical protein
MGHVRSTMAARMGRDRRARIEGGGAVPPCRAYQTSIATITATGHKHRAASTFIRTLTWMAIEALAQLKLRSRTKFSFPVRVLLTGFVVHVEKPVIGAFPHRIALN